MNARPHIHCVFGPTASGKTAYAIKLAKDLNGCIINADSVQIYSALRDLSARPSAEEEAQAPHRLYGVLPASSACNAVKWAKLATQEIKRAQNLGLSPILVGGTGLYFRALLEGLSPIPEVDPKIDQAVRAMASEQMDGILRLTGETHFIDRQRKQRAVAVYVSSGRSLRHWQSLEPTPFAGTFDFHMLWPERDRLYEKINQRFEIMIREGQAVEEVRALLASNPPKDAPIMRAIGVPEIASFLNGTSSLEEAISSAQQATRRYAKRQFTWMRSTKQKFEQDLPLGSHFQTLSSPNKT